LGESFENQIKTTNLAGMKRIRVTYPELCVLCLLKNKRTSSYSLANERKKYQITVSDKEYSALQKIDAGGSFDISDNIRFICKDLNGNITIELNGVSRLFSTPVDSAIIASYPKFKQETGDNVLVIGDLHAPFIKDGYLDFCKRIYAKYNCKKVVFAGDVIDNHFSSYHETDADGMAAGQELDAAIKALSGFYEAFPVAMVCDGNHDQLVRRKAATGGISSRWIKPMNEVLGVPGWTFADEFIINKVKYIHGIGMKIEPRVMAEMCSVVQGHWHSDSKYVTFVNEKELMFGLQIGTGVDRRSYAMAYGKHFKKPQVNVGVVMDSGRWGLIEHMIL